jgi:hypothetical protein
VYKGEVILENMHPAMEAYMGRGSKALPTVNLGTTVVIGQLQAAVIFNLGERFLDSKAILDVVTKIIQSRYLESNRWHPVWSPHLPDLTRLHSHILHNACSSVALTVCSGLYRRRSWPSLVRTYLLVMEVPAPSTNLARKGHGTCIAYMTL